MFPIKKSDSCESHRQPLSQFITPMKSETLFFRTNDHCLLNEAILSIKRKEMDNDTKNVSYEVIEMAIETLFDRCLACCTTQNIILFFCFFVSLLFNKYSRSNLL